MHSFSLPVSTVVQDTEFRVSESHIVVLRRHVGHVNSARMAVPVAFLATLSFLGINEIEAEEDIVSKIMLLESPAAPAPSRL